MQDVKNLRVWHLARELSVSVIEALPERGARKVPGLRSQTIRAATSVAANLAEGCGRATWPEFLHSVEIALASVNELETHVILPRVILPRDAGIFTEELYAELQEHTELVRRMLISLMRTLQRRIALDESARCKADASTS